MVKKKDVKQMNEALASGQPVSKRWSFLDTLCIRFCVFYSLFFAFLWISHVLFLLGALFACRFSCFSIRLLIFFSCAYCVCWRWWRWRWWWWWSWCCCWSCWCLRLSSFFSFVKFFLLRNTHTNRHSMLCHWALAARSSSNYTQSEWKQFAVTIVYWSDFLGLNTATTTKQKKVKLFTSRCDFSRYNWRLL